MTSKSQVKREQVQMGLPLEGAVLDLEPAVNVGYGFLPEIMPDVETPKECFNVGIYKISDEVTTPKYATDGSMCFDIRAFLLEGSEVAGYNNINRKICRSVSTYFFTDDDKQNYNSLACMIDPGERLLIPTGLIFDLPENTSLILYSLSGVSLKQGLKLSNSVGVIDSDYVNPTFVILENTTNTRLLIKNGDRIAQGEVVLNPPRVCFSSLNEPPVQKTTRNGGFGSTGK